MTSRLETNDSELSLIEDENFLVYARVRPTTHESEDFLSPAQMNFLKPTEYNICVKHPYNKNIDRREKPYLFDGVFNENHSNIDVFNKCVKINLDGLLQGYNTTFFAYGMTGSGKTHTIFGGKNEKIEEKGIFVMAIENILSKVKEIKNKGIMIKFSYLEIYNENVRDLLSDGQKSLNIIEDPIRGGVYVPELKQNIIQNINQIENLITIGNQKRALASTMANQYSSRSHAILQLNIEIRSNSKNNDEIITSKLTIVDLAGSERAIISLDNRGLLEGSNINKSLLALGNCINILSEKNKKNSFVPYRDSKLTRLLKDSLGGNTKTVMIACISSNYHHFEETLNTLNYANRARKIKKKIIKNIQENNVDDIKYKQVFMNINENIEFLKKLINQPVFCNNCKNFVKENKNMMINSLKITEQKNMIEQIKNFEHIFGIEISNIYKVKSNKIMNDKNNILNDIKTLNNKSSIQEERNNDEYIERISNDIMANIEENYEIKQSLRELEEIIVLNERNIIILRDQKHKLTNSFEINENEEEFQNLLKNNQENIEIKSKLQNALSVNLSQKEILFDLLLKLSDDQKKNSPEIELKALQKDLENLDLLSQNNELLKEIHIKDKFLLEKETQLTLLRQEILDLKCQISLTNISLNSPHEKRRKDSSETNKLFLKTSPKSDLLLKKNKSDCFQNDSKNEIIVKSNNDFERLTIKKTEYLDKKEKESLQETFKSPYKLSFKNDKENMFPNKQKKKENKEPIITKIELYKSSESANTEIIKISAKKRRTTSSSRRYDQDPNFNLENIPLSEFKIEDSKHQIVSYDKLKFINRNIEDSVILHNSNPLDNGFILDSCTIKNPLVSLLNSTKNINIKQSFEDYKISQLISEKKNRFDSAFKNPMESESENDIEKTMMGSPVIEKSSRNYYTTSKPIISNRIINVD